MSSAQILIFDSPESAHRLKAILDTRDWEIHTPQTIKEALELLNTCDIDVALINTELKDTDAFAGLGELIRQCPDLRVMVVAEYSSLDRAVEALRRGAHGYVIKPFARDALSKSIEDAVAQKRLIVSERKRAESELMEFKDELDRLVLKKSSHLIEVNAKLREDLESLITEGGTLRALFETSQEPIFLKDLNLKYMMVNPAMERLLETSEQNCVGKTDGELFGEEIGNSIRKYDTRVLQGEIIEKEQIIFIKGVPTTLHFMKVPLREGSGEITGLWGTVRDVTETKRVEQWTHTTQRMESVATLAAGIAHNFNNLLTGILGTVSLLLMDINPDDAKYRKLKKVEEYVRNGVDLTRQLLGFARGGKYEVKILDLNEIAEKTTAVFAQSQKLITIHKKMEPNLYLIKGDQNQIEQVLLNLYLNAGHAMPGGGDLYIDTENVFLDEAYVRHYTVKPGRYVQVRVRDTGLGMKPETMERIFEPFFTTKEVGEGKGLGLAAVYGIVKNHGGFIQALSEKGLGTTFEILFPALEEEKEKGKNALP
ncbi:MAG: PAS domain-containing protein [Deltaproteobacteria bacterium]|nr:PAS domain-containing protein [Deltaproteobacteria bacterium]